jgi:cell division protease FtsH
MIFFDELDKVLPNPNEEYFTDASKAVLTQLLTLIDGMEKVNNIVFVATCNDYYALPESITRAGRFDKKICLDLPDYAARVAILNMYMNASPVSFAMKAESIGKLTGGFSPAALKTLVNDCILSSDENNFASEKIIRDKITEIKEEDLPTERSEQSYNVDAVRNVGSFVVARAYSNSDYLLTVEDEKVCNGFIDAIISGACYDGEDDDEYYDDDEDRERKGEYSLCTKNDMLAAITSLLGGFAAEELIFNKLYSNLESNAHSVENLLFKMSEYGMLGLSLYFNCYNDYRYSDKARERLEEEFTRIKDECYAKAKEQVEKNENLIRKLVPLLIKRKSIEKEECEKIIAELGGIA